MGQESKERSVLYHYGSAIFNCSSQSSLGRSLRLGVCLW